MRQLISRCRAAISQFIYKGILLAVTILFCVGVGIAMANMYRLSSSLIESQALQNATLYAQAIKEARTLYSSDVLTPLNTANAINFTHDYNPTKVTVPVPATFLIELGKNLTKKNPEVSLRLYSDYPFPWRREEGGVRDDFERQAITYLTKNPTQKFYRVDNYRGKPAFRYAEADLLSSSCVNCHNTHRDSPKTDWKVGDLRGILEITQPLDTITQNTQSELKNLFLLLVGLSVLGVTGLTLAISRLRQNAKQLEQRVRERTAQLQETNVELLKEQEKSDRLLLNILPESIAARLKDGQSCIADRFPEVTILFADIVGFTVLSAQISPEELIEFLNEIFSAFDYLTKSTAWKKSKQLEMLTW
jgi:adenylate cyclase